MGAGSTAPEGGAEARAPLPPLYLDRSDDPSVAGRPRTHALVVGVSEYPFLPGAPESPPDQRPEILALKIGQMTVAARTAFVFAKWLQERQDDFDPPLATIRLLLAPSKGERDSTPELAKYTSPCRLDDFLEAANLWRKASLDNPSGMTIFSFVGHGFELSPKDPVLLLADFGRPGGPVLRAAVRVGNLYYGMGPLEWQPRIAKKQVYFIDTSRDPSGSLPDPWKRGTSLIFDAAVPGVEERAGGVIYASESGQPAYAVKNDVSLFYLGFKKCMSGEAVIPGPRGDGSERTWNVTVNSMIAALSKALSEVAGRRKVQQNVTTFGQVSDAVLLRCKPPQLALTLTLEPPEAAVLAAISLMNESGDLVLRRDPAPGPFTATVAGGRYIIEVNFDSSSPAYRRKTLIQDILPPGLSLTVKVEATATPQPLPQAPAPDAAGPDSSSAAGGAS